MGRCLGFMWAEAKKAFGSSQEGRFNRTGKTVGPTSVKSPGIEGIGIHGSPAASASF